MIQVRAQTSMHLEWNGPNERLQPVTLNDMQKYIYLSFPTDNTGWNNFTLWLPNDCDRVLAQNLCDAFNVLQHTKLPELTVDEKTRILMEAPQTFEGPHNNSGITEAEAAPANPDDGLPF